MKSLVKSRRSSLTIFLIIGLCIILIKCIERSNHSNVDYSIENLEYGMFAGTQSCANCHKQIYENFIATGHFLTSEPSSIKNIKGSFQKGENTFHYNPQLYVAMEKRDSGLFQVEYIDGIKTISRPFDITIGSATRGQTFLSWQNNLLTQLPISYLTSVNQWANSPGDQNQVYFDRPINSRCLECHTTYAEVIPFRLENSPEEFDHNKIVYGVGCEKCHGPAAKHVEYQTQNPKITTAKYIINPGDFVRQQSIDLCSLCHGGRIKSTQPSFSYTAGDTLKNYFIIDTLNNGSIDVHGNQYGLLAKSKCFTTSSMTCLTCHDPHTEEKGNLKLYSQRCMTCHNQEHASFCKLKTLDAATLSSNCIDCHMPKESSKSIVLQLEDQKVPTAQLLRSHYITVYPDATKKFMLNNP